MPFPRKVIAGIGALVAGLAVAFGSVGMLAPSAFADSSLCTNFQQCSDSGRSDHGYGAVADQSHWGMYGGHNCTNYIAYMLGTAGVRQPDYQLGNAADWGSAAAAAGVPVDDVPTVGAVAWWSSGAGGLSWAGHVAWVEQVTADAITISEDNYPYGPYDWRVIPRGSSGWPTGFVHFTVAEAAEQPSIVTTATGGTAVATVRTDRSVALATRPRAGAAWTVATVAPAGSALGGPSLVLGPGGLAEIAVRGPLSTLVLYARRHAGSPWTMEQVTGPGAATSAPTALLSPDGGLAIAAAGPSGVLELFSAAPLATGAGHTRRWTTAVLAGPGSDLSRPAMVAGPAGSTDIAVVGPGHSLVLHTGTADGLWAVQNVSAAGTAFADPSMLARPHGLEIATVGPRRTAEVHLSGAGATAWSVDAVSAPGAAFDAPVLLPAADGAVAVAVTGRRGTLTVRRPASGAGLAPRVGQAVGTGPVTVSAPDVSWSAAGTVQLAVITPDGRLEVYTRRHGRMMAG